MTTIVAIRTGDSVLLAADSQTTVCGAIRQTTAEPKVYAVGGLARVALGVAGSVRFSNIVRHCQLPDGLEAGADPHEWIIRRLIPVLRAACEDAGYSQQDGEQQNELIVAIGGRAWRMFGDWSVFEPAGPFLAIGSGECYAIGALHALEADDRLGRVHAAIALDAAAAYDLGTGGPMTYATTGGEA